MSKNFILLACKNHHFIYRNTMKKSPKEGQEYHWALVEKEVNNTLLPNKIFFVDLVLFLSIKRWKLSKLWSTEVILSRGSWRHSRRRKAGWNMVRINLKNHKNLQPKSIQPKNPVIQLKENLLSPVPSDRKCSIRLKISSPCRLCRLSMPHPPVCSSRSPSWLQS